MSGRPVMIVQARVQPSRLDEFRAWYLRDHLPHVLAIPGIVDHRRVSWCGSPRRDAPNVISAFLFEHEGVIENALRSKEARLARGDWDRWSDVVRDLTVQIYAVLDAHNSVRHLS